MWPLVKYSLLVVM